MAVKPFIASKRFFWNKPHQTFPNPYKFQMGHSDRHHSSKRCRLDIISNTLLLNIVTEIFLVHFLTLNGFW